MGVKNPMAFCAPKRDSATVTIVTFLTILSKQINRL